MDVSSFTMVVLGLARSEGGGASATRKSVYFFDNGIFECCIRMCKVSLIAPLGELVVVVRHVKHL